VVEPFLGGPGERRNGEPLSMLPRGVSGSAVPRAVSQINAKKRPIRRAAGPDRPP
jgi:hypothetical protein